MISKSKQSPERTRAETGAMTEAPLRSALHGGGHTHNTAPTRFVDVDGIATDFVDR